MIDKKIIPCTAARLYDMGLLQAIKAGSTIIKGEYKMTPEGLKFDQQTIIFRDKFNEICYVKFSDDKELLKFANDYASNYELI